MDKQKSTRLTQGRQNSRARTAPRRFAAWLWVAAIGVTIVAAVLLFRRPNDSTRSFSDARADSSPQAKPSDPSDRSTPRAIRPGATNLPSIEVNQAVMVTVELDFGDAVPGIAEALREIERRHQPDDGIGRTFAILDAYGEPTTDGRKLHLSMHVSTEKPGIGSLVFRRTDAVLWQNRIVATTNKSHFTGGQLSIYVDTGNGQLATIDGSSNPSSLLAASIKETGRTLGEMWLEDERRELVFIYSACGCPVKVMCQRKGDRLVRTSAMPVIFPDDPAVLEVIRRLLRW